MYTDGSFQMDENTRGASVVMTFEGKEFSLSKKLHSVFNSTECELFGIWMALIVGMKYPIIRCIRTDSMAAITISTKKLEIYLVKAGKIHYIKYLYTDDINKRLIRMSEGTQ